MSYQKLIEKLKTSDQQKEEVSSASDDRKLSFLEFKDPSILRFRILPHKKDPEDVPFEKVFIHLGFEHPNFAKRVPMKCKGKDCPMCAFYKKRLAGGDTNAWRYKSNQRFIYYVEYEDAKGNLKLALLSLTYYAQEELKNKMISQLKAGVNIFDLHDGRWIEMTMKKIGDKRKYIVSVETESDSVTDMNILNWYKDLRSLDQFYKDYSLEDIKKILKGEKIESRSGSSSNGPTNNPKNKKESTAGMKFASDEVESIDNAIPDVAEETPQNMKRLEDIMNRTDEDDFE